MKSKIYNIASIFFICLILGLGRALLIQDINIIKESPKKVETIPDRITEPVLVDIEISKKLFKEGALFIDARDRAVYSEGHIENSINIPWESSDNEMINEKLLGIKYDRDVVIYCSGGDCTLSLDLGDYIFDELSFENVFIFEGGYPLWIENYLPIKKLCEIDQSTEVKDESCIYVE